ncbi:hypothetical protein NDU88_000192 [Pleurodeles waltl]|uniref:Uncharacterized protein n=1 Tax=Pleurodeles waltl TaxID=8319 RepID=A0AAV7KWN2_PLEWA|nr:hypothetical protein NDU88_000192 [Pleurodeles waltl]
MRRSPSRHPQLQQAMPWEQPKGPNHLHAFLETLFGALPMDSATIKQDNTTDIKGRMKDMNELGDREASLEQTCETQGEELDAHCHKILDLQDKNTELQYQVEDPENMSRTANIRIKGIPLQAARGNLEEYVRRLFHHVVLELALKEIILDRTHRAWGPATPQSRMI